jgi:hypothetical protein
LNREAALPDNGPGHVWPTAILMGKPAEGTRFPPAERAWPRRAVIGLWLVLFFVGGGALVVNWDSLMTRLARPPLGGPPASEARR